MLLEAAAADSGYESYTLALDTEAVPWVVDTRAMVAQIAHEIARGRSPKTVSRCFHNSVALMIESVCSKLRERSGVNSVCLSGGTFQNFTLLKGTLALLRQSGFQVFLHSQVPSNDGGLSLGQAVIAAAFLERM
jgi:hydrogenase maturation protein HypF